MSISLHTLSVGRYLQTLGALQGVLKKGRDHCQANAVDPDSLMGERLCGDMLPLSFQLVSAAHHSIGAIDAARSGQSGPPPGPMPETYAAGEALIADAIARLKALAPEEVDALEGGTVVFNLGQTRLPFSAEGYILSFSLPNFFFHASTAYGILRMKGVPLGKRDFMGAMMLKM